MTSEDWDIYHPIYGLLFSSADPKCLESSAEDARNAVQPNGAKDTQYSFRAGLKADSTYARILLKRTVRLEPALSSLPAINVQASAQIYTTLDIGELRLITLFPGDPEDEIHSQVNVAKLGEEIQEYEALSYVWGSQSRHKPIKMNGINFMVTENLYDALKRLRYPDKQRILWIDALAINQLDVTERNHQVQDMSKIYSGAQRVLMWLGEESQEMNAWFEFIDIMAGSSLDLAMVLDWDAVEEALWAVCEKPYWRRVWVQQEVAMARDAVLLCGSNSMPYPFARKIMNQLREVVLRYRELEHDEAYEVSHLTWHNSMESIGLLSVPYPGSALGDNYFDVLSWLNFMSGKECRDPRDYVYGFASCLAPEIRQKLEIDYSLPVRDVYRNAAEAIVEAADSLDFICWGKTFLQEWKDNPHAKEKELPSWVPIFSRAALDGLSVIRPKRVGQVFFCEDPVARLSLDRKTLHVKGVFIGTVERTLKIPWASIFGREALDETFEFEKYVVEKLESELLKDQEHDSRIAEQTIRCLGLDIRRSMMDQALRGALFWGTTDKFSIENRRKWLLFAIESLHHSGQQLANVGLGPIDAEPGDKVCILVGCSTVVVLREAGEKYAVVGDMEAMGSIADRVFAGIKRDRLTPEPIMLC
jgi:hypothetical protein